MKGLWLHQGTVPSVSPQLTSNEQRGREPIACRHQLVQLILEFLVAVYEMCRSITGKLISSPRLDGMAPRRLALKRSQHACTCSKYKMYSIVYKYLKMEYCYRPKFLYNYNKTKQQNSNADHTAAIL